MSIKHNKARAAVLGLALGDAYGRRLEFLRGEQVRTTPAGPGHDFMWTDDTHMSLYLGEAILDFGGGALHADEFGQCVGAQFSAWLADPLTPSTAPGNTCIAGVQAWRRDHDWRSSGVPTSDGCGAVMRIAPLPIRFAGAELAEAAEIQARLTHGHPNAAEAAVAASWLTRELLEGRPLSTDLIAQAVARFSDGTWSSTGGTTAEALRAAVREAGASGRWLDEAAIPAGDGGWRSPSALGLALAAALRWGVDAHGEVTPERFAEAVDRAARIDGDSDSVACLTGMFLGAAGGMSSLPSDWLAALPQRGHIAGLVDRMLAQAEPLVTAAPEDVWVAVADLHGHPAHLDRLLEHLDAELGDRWNLVTLGDYVDNGPDIPGLLERLIALREERGDRYVPIIGNHDVACLRAMGWPLDNGPDRRWCAQWSRNYWSPGGSTVEAYGARSAATLAEAMPPHHKAFLRSLPWLHDTGEYLFVHAGMESGPLGPQRRKLINQLLPATASWLPPQLREKALAGVSDPSWERVVVSGHTKNPAARTGITRHAPHVMTPTRVCLSGEIDQSGVLYAIELPSRRIWSVDASGNVSARDTQGVESSSPRTEEHALRRRPRAR
ncbi:MAG: ADP-ribosylglycohydrolase family protein [Myxococcota bacterium]|nr:ADP-ribosylglycohydrolase family protein [Myxococcota bacterium]